MSNPIKEHLNENIGRAKEEGQLRAENIRGLLSDVAELTAAEIKEGTERMKAIVKGAIADALGDLKDTSSEIPDRVTNSIEHAIDESTRYRKETIASLQAKMHEIQVQIDQRQHQLDRDIEDSLVDVKTTTAKDSAPLSSALDRVITKVKDRETSASLKQQYLNLKFQLANLDTKLSDRYGHRYAEVKQQLESVKTLYDKSKAEAEANGVTPIQSKQTEIERKLSKFAASAVIVEQEIVKYLQELWKNKGFDSKHN